MALAIRLARGGAKKRPYYRIVVADSRAPRDGRFLEKLGTYNPLLAKDSPDRVKLDAERISHWLSVGAQPSDRVLRFLDAAGIRERAARSNPNKGKPGEKATERVEERATKVAAAEEARAAAAAAPAPEPEEAPVVEETPVVEPIAEEPAAVEPVAEEGPAVEANEATPDSDAGDTPAEVTGESAQAPAEGAAEDASAENAPAEETSAAEVSAEEAPAEKATARKASTKKVSTEEAPAAEAAPEEAAAETSDADVVAEEAVAEAGATDAA